MVPTTSGRMLTGKLVGQLQDPPSCDFASKCGTIASVLLTSNECSTEILSFADIHGRCFTTYRAESDH